MASWDAATHRLPFLRDFSARDRERAERAVRQQEARERHAHAVRARTAAAAVEEHRRRLRDLLGPRRSARLREAIQRERLDFRAGLQPPGGLIRDFTRHRQASRRRIDALMRQHGASRDRVEPLVRRHTERLRELLAAAEGKVTTGFHLPSHLKTWMRLSSLHTHPLPWGIAPPGDPNDPHRWFVERAPWFGFLFRFAFDASDNFRAGRQLFLDPSAGLVGNEVTLDCRSADDADQATATAEAQIAFGFTAPVAGLVEVLIDAQSLTGTHDLTVEDEFGFSHAWANQSNYLMMNVLHPNVPEPSLALMSSPYRIGGQAAFAARVSDGDDFSLHREYLTRGQHYFAQLVSAGPVPAGHSVVVSVGTRSLDFGSVDDMEYHGRSNFQWFLSSVQVRIAP